MMDDQVLAETLAEIFMRYEYQQYDMLEKFPLQMQRPIKLALGRKYIGSVNTLVCGVNILKSIDAIADEEIVRLAETLCLGDYPRLGTCLELYQIAGRPEAGLARLRTEGSLYFKKEKFYSAIEAFSLCRESEWLIKIGRVMEEKGDRQIALKSYIAAGDAAQLTRIGEIFLHTETRGYDSLDLAKQAFMAANSPAKVAEVAQDYIKKASLEGYDPWRRGHVHNASMAYKAAASISEEPLKTYYEQMATGLEMMA